MTEQPIDFCPARNHESHLRQDPRINCIERGIAVYERFCLMRHGHTDWNREGRLQGRKDVALNDQGREYAFRAAERLKGSAWGLVVASDLARAAETGRIIASVLGLPLFLDAGLRERDMGPLEGLTLTEVTGRFGPMPLGGNYPMLNMESLSGLSRRAAATMSRIALDHPGGHIVAVAHGGIISAFLYSIFGGQTPAPGHPRIGNAQFVELLHHAGEWRPISGTDPNIGHNEGRA